LRSIVIHGLLLTSAFFAMAWLAPQLDVADARKPIDSTAAFAFVGLMIAAGFVWWSACFRVRRAAASRSHLWWILGFALLFRGIVVAAPPILELDLYRYLWDGFVSANGVDPFRYSPAEVSEAIRFGDLEPDLTLRSLAAAVERDPAMASILARVHYPDLPTVYPPVAQTLFRLSEALSSGATVERRILVLKSLFVICESVTLALVMLLLRRCDRPTSWIILPAWCPLAVVCVANQGHLDSLPAMLSISAVAVLAPAITPLTAISAGILLAIAGAAKIYPLLLTPLITAFLWRRATATRRTRTVVLFATALIATSAVVWSPLLRLESRREGFSAFAGQWQMYDSYFAVVAANLKIHEPPNPKPWYSFVPEAIKRDVSVPDQTARGLWLASVGLIAVYLMRRLWNDPTLEWLLESVFLLLVWFWAIGPVCNPWYLMWMLPFLPFARNGGWMALYFVAPMFFLRFGMTARFGEVGEYWFDHGMVFVLTACWLIPVMLSRRTNQRLESNSTGTITFSDPERNPSRSTLT
jgi:hypothetical protein